MAKTASTLFESIWGEFPVIRSDNVVNATAKPLGGISRLVIGREGTVGMVWLQEQRGRALTLRTVQQAQDTRERELMLELERKAALIEHLLAPNHRKTVQELVARLPARLGSSAGTAEKD
jgi:hypothetical protein